MSGELHTINQELASCCTEQTELACRKCLMCREVGVNVDVPCGTKAGAWVRG